MLSKKNKILTITLFIMLFGTMVFAADTVQIRNKYNDLYDPPYIEVYKTEKPDYYMCINRFSFYIPANINLCALARNGKGVRFYTDDGLAELGASWSYNVGPRPDAPGRSIDEFYRACLSFHPNAEFARLGSNWYVVCYIENDTIVYRKTFANNDTVETVEFRYPVNMADKYNKVCEVLDATFIPSWAR